MSSSSYVPPPFPFPEAWPQLFRSQQTTWLAPSHPWPPAAASRVYGASRPPAAAAAAAAPFTPFGWYFSPPAFPYKQPEAQSDISSSNRRSNDASSCDDDDDEEESDDGDDGEFVYGYVLSDEWRGRFRSSQHARQQKLKQEQEQQRRRQAQQQQTPKSHGARAKKRRQQLVASISDLAVRDLQREFAAAKQREADTRRALPNAGGELHPQDEYTREALQDVCRLEAQLNLRFDEFCDAFAPVVWPHD